MKTLLTCICVDIHPGRVEPAPPIKLTTSLTEALGGSTVLCELTKGFHPVLSPSCAAEDSRSGEGFQACLDRGYPRLQLA